MAVTVFDVAKYILEKRGMISAMKLQKLVYYSQAWSLVWDDEPLFNEKIEAWANGPVVRELYEVHRGQFNIGASSIAKHSSNELNATQKETINTVLEAYGNKSAQWLSDQTHIERPWKDARQGMTDTERGNTEIKLSSMMNYYSSLQ